MRSIVSGAEDTSAASTMELVTAARSIAAELAHREAPESGMSAVELAETLGRTLDLLEAGLATLVRRVDDTGSFGEFGFSSTGAWLRSHLGMRDGRAAERVRLARQLPRLTAVAQKLAGGDLSLGFAGAIADAVTRLDDQDAALAEELLLGLVEQGHTAGQLAKDGAQITDLINQHRGREKEPDDSKRGFSRSWLSKSTSLDGGSWVRAWLTPEHSATFEQIIGPLAKPKAAGDDRDLAQRTADALMAVISGGNRNASVTVIVDLVAYTEATGDTGPFTGAARRSGNTETAGSASPTEPTDLSDPNDLSDLFDPAGAADLREQAVADPNGPWSEPSGSGYSRRGFSGQQREADTSTPDESAPPETGPTAGSASGPMDDPLGEPCERGEPKRATNARGRPRVAARLLDGTPISPARARQIALSAGVNGLVLGRAGHPLYLGHKVRFATPAQRKALLALYDACCVNGCRIPAHLCEIHHLEGGWKFLTPTDIDKLAPACGWHNRWVEAHAEQVEEARDDQGRTVLRILPPWEKRAVRAP